MADALRPLSLLLAAACLWALSVLILALSGLGSRFAAAPADTTPPPLPNVSLTRSQSRLGPLSDYAEVGARPLLTLDRRPAPALAVDGQAGVAELDVVLTSVLITPRLQLAILTDNKDGASRRVRVGETVEGSNWRLVQLEPRKAVIEGPSGQRTLDLRVFDGKGGPAPTALARAAEAGQQGVAPKDLTAPPLALNPQVVVEPIGKPQPLEPAATQAAQDQQVEAIRRRIEARRAQMRAEAAAAGSSEK